jgi:hypothetical protein
MEKIMFTGIMRKVSNVFLGLPLIAGIAANAQMPAIKFQSASTQTALLELYTSEGCSSCPPAEAWLSRLQDSPRLWRDFAPIALHVDYWNYLGWKDAWSDSAFSKRQRSFAQVWRSETIYTPEFVLNGREWHNCFTCANGPQPDGEKAGVLTVTSPDTNRWQASFVPEKPMDVSYEIHAALLAGGIISEVKAGENQGRKLKHDFVVVKLLQAGLAVGGGVASGIFILETPRHNYGKTLALTAWVSRAGALDPVQTTGGWLIPPVKD